MQKYIYKEIALDQLYPDTENFRFDPVSDDKEAILAMVNLIPTKIYTLVKSIISNGGIDPSILPNVVPYSLESKNYVVMEGNRRIVSLKIIKNLDLIKDSNHYEKFNKLLAKYNLEEIPNKFLCAVYQNKADTYFWTFLRHSGELNGEGLVPWNPQSIERFKITTQNISPSSSFYILKYLKDNTDYTVDAKARIGTTLSRIVDSAVGKEYYGLNINPEKQTLSFSKDKKETINKLCLLIDYLTNQKINSRNANKKNDIAEWIYRLDSDYRLLNDKKNSYHSEKKENSTPSSYNFNSNSTNTYSEETKTSQGNDKDKNDTYKKENYTKPNPSNDKESNNSTSNSKIKIRLFEDLEYIHVEASNFGGIINVGNELTKISKSAFNTYPIATAMLLRTYIEQSFKYFLQKTLHWDNLVRQNKGKDPALESILSYCRTNKKQLFSDSVIKRTFESCFNEDATIKLLLDLNIHQPNIVKITATELEGFKNRGLAKILNYLLS